MATGHPGGPAARVPPSGARPSEAPGRVAGAAEPPSGRSGRRAPRLGERPPAAVEKRGPYTVLRAPSVQAKLQKHRDVAKAGLRRKGVLGASPGRPDSAGKRCRRRHPLCAGSSAWETEDVQPKAELGSPRRPPVRVTVVKSVKFNKGYTALSQSPDENLVSLDSDSDGELESTYSSGYSSAEQVNQDVSRQLLQDGYHLDEIPDDEDLDLIPPKSMASSTCSCCCCCLGESSSCNLQ